MFARKKCQKKSLFVFSVALLCVSCLIFAGCSSSGQAGGNGGQNGANQTQNGQNGANQTDGNAADGSDQNSATGNVAGSGDANGAAQGGELHQRAEKIASAITDKVSQVKDARAVISERLAYVSVSIDEDAGAAESSALKDEISEVVKETDSEIDDVYVMEDADTFARMKEIGDDIADGKPVSGFADELKTMFARVIPTKE